MKVRRFSQGLLLTAFLFTGLAAHAGLILTLDDGTTSVSVEDLDGDGRVDFNDSLGVWAINFTMGLTNPWVGSEHLDVMDLFSANVTGISGGTLTVSLTRTGLERSPSNWMTSLGGTTDGTIQFSTLLNGIAISEYFASTSAFSYTDSGHINELEPYSLSLVASITHDSGQDMSSFDYVVKVPAPSTLALLGGALLLTGWMGSRRRREV